MSEFIDHRSYIYGHGLISQNCFAKQYSNETGLGVTLVETGTFVKIHSIRDDDVLFCIVRDDMQVENNQLVCRKADIINVPENLWGPLFTVKKMLRLSLVKDSKVAESIGNLGVGHTVRVLGPDNTPICTAKITFRNSILKLGVGIYFGLQILNPRENLKMITEKVSLLRPETKGFPRGCDIVVTIDKLCPNNCNWNQEKETFYYDKECKKELVRNYFDEPDPNSQSFKSVITHNLKNKHSNNNKKEKAVCCSDSDINITHSYLTNCDIPLKVGDEVVYLNGDTPEKGFVRWIGVIENSVKVGVEFENPIGIKAGVMDCLGELFKAKNQHALFVSPMALIKLSDFLMDPSEDANHLNSSSSNSSCSSSHNNNNNVITNNDNEINQDSASTNYKNSVASNYLKTNLSINNKNNNNNSNNNNNNNSSSNNNNNSHCSTNRNNNDVYCRSNEFCYGEEHNAEESYKKLRKGSSSRQCLKHAERCFETGDCLPGRNKEEITEEKDSTKRCQVADGAFESEYEAVSKNFVIAEANERKLGCQRNCNPDDSGFVQEKNFYMTLQNPKSVSRYDRPSHDLYDLAGPKQERSKRSHLCAIKKIHKSFDGGDDDFNFCDSNTDRNASTFFEKEQSLSARNWTAESESGGDALYDVPPRAVRYVSVSESLPSSSGTSHPNHSRYFPQHHQQHSPSFNQQHQKFASTKKDTWGSQLSEHSSSDEYLADHSGPSRLCPEDLGRGSVVELNYKGEAHFGVIRWIGTIPCPREDASSRLMAGIEMEEEYPEFTDGTFKNKRYFQCNPKKALFVPLSKCRKDSRFLEETQKQSLPSKINYGQIDCPIVEGTIPPINRKSDIDLICGKNKGIQGHHNSCYLDATLFSMFAFTSVFDSLLYRPPTKNDIPQYSEVQRVLREEIVNPLRKNFYVRADRVMKLRTLLEKLSSVSGLTSEEKDPEEFLNSLLAQILKAEPFLKLSSGQEAFHYQLFVEKDERLVLPTVQQLFEQSFVTSDIKLKQVPSCLIIQMPRFGKSFKMYSKILPPQLLDITDIIENSPRQCTVCGKLAEFECKDCFGQQGIGNGLESISFCKTCLETAHNHHCRSRHNSRALTVPMEFYELQEHCIIPRLYMELFAVVCIETSHYVAFVKCGSGSDAPWCFFDSMADRKGEQNGYNIPEMVPCPDLPYWLSEDGAKMLNEMRDERQLTDHAKRLFSDAYMCMYQSPDLMMYR